MEIIKRFSTSRMVTIETDYGDFEVPYTFIGENPVYVALEPYGNLSDYKFSVVLLTGDDHDFDGSWWAEFSRTRVAVVQFSEEEIGGEPDSEEWNDFIMESLQDVTPED